MGHTASRFAGLLLGCAAASAAFATLPGASAFADPLALSDPYGGPASIFDGILRPRPAIGAPQAVIQESIQEPTQDIAPIAVPERLRRQVVDYPTTEPPGTIVIDTAHTYLYLVLAGGKAVRYGIGVGRDGFTWSGVETIARKAEWPDWYPPAEMIQRQPYLPRMVTGGPGNPLGARAMYLGGTAYRIHGTNAPQTIGGHVSSGCIRMLNEDVIDLYNRVSIGTKVVVLPAGPRHEAPAIVKHRTAPTVAPVAASGATRGIY